MVVTGASDGFSLVILEALMQTCPQARFELTCRRALGTTNGVRLRWQQLHLRDQNAIYSWALGFQRMVRSLNCAIRLHGDIGGPDKSICAKEIGKFWAWY